MLKNKYNKLYLNTARNCLRYVIRAFKITEIYIPYYICPSVRLAIKKENCKINFYHIDVSFNPTQEFSKNSYILYPNYFGVCSKIVEELAKKYPNLIVDNAHSFYSLPIGIASFSSLRKFFPKLRNGAILFTKEKHNEDFVVDSDFYEYEELSFEEICKNEAKLDNQDICKISNSTYKYFSMIDIEKEKERRLKNFENWNSKLAKINLINLNLQKDDVPFSYPFIVKEEKDVYKFVKEFSEQGIITYRYWNNLPKSYQERLFYTNLISIPL